MPICKYCGKDTEDIKTITCISGYIEYEDSVSFSREPYSEDEEEKCSVCHVSPGAYHHKGCYMGRCPRCGERLVSCGCLIIKR
jgi:hypothetical protein